MLRLHVPTPPKNMSTVPCHRPLGPFALSSISQCPFLFLSSTSITITFIVTQTFLCFSSTLSDLEVLHSLPHSFGDLSSHHNLLPLQAIHPVAVPSPAVHPTYKTYKPRSARKVWKPSVTNPFHILDLWILAIPDVVLLNYRTCKHKIWLYA